MHQAVSLSLSKSTQNITMFTCHLVRFYPTRRMRSVSLSIRS